jgi:hypothetical protein
MLEPRLVLEYWRSLQGSRTAQRYPRCCGQLQQGLGLQAELSPTGNGRKHWSTAIRPLNRHPDEPTLWMFDIKVSLPILAPDSAGYCQALAS